MENSTAGKIIFDYRAATTFSAVHAHGEINQTGINQLLLREDKSAKMGIATTTEGYQIAILPTH